MQMLFGQFICLHREKFATGVKTICVILGEPTRQNCAERLNALLRQSSAGAFSVTELFSFMPCQLRVTCCAANFLSFAQLAKRKV